MKKFKVVRTYTAQEVHIVAAKSAEKAEEFVASGHNAEEYLLNLANGINLGGDDVYLVKPPFTDPESRSYMDEQIVSVEEIEEGGKI